MDVRRGDVAVLRSAGRTRSASPAVGRAPTDPAGGPTGGSRVVAVLGAALAAGPAVVLVLVAAITVPPAALVLVMGLGLLTGGLTGVFTGFVAADPRRGTRVAVRTAAAAVPVVVAGAGLIAALGPVSVIALPAFYAAGGLAWWARSEPISHLLRGVPRDRF